MSLVNDASNLNEDPLFVDSDNGNYCITSASGLQEICVDTIPRDSLDYYGVYISARDTCPVIVILNKPSRTNQVTIIQYLHRPGKVFAVINIDNLLKGGLPNGR